MREFLHDLVAVERKGIDVRAGVSGVLVLGVFALAMAVVGPVAMAAVIGALVILSADPPPPGRAFGVALVPLVVAGALLTYFAVWFGGDAVAGAVIGGLVALVSTLQAGRGRRAGARGLIATIWVILALTLYDSEVSALAFAVAFGIGGAAGGVVAWLRARPGTPEGTEDDDVEHEAGATTAPTPATAPEATPVPSLGALLRSPLGPLAVLRGLGIGLGIWIGFTFFPAHAAWVAITSLIVIRPPTRKAVVVGVQRSLGTGVGVTLAVGLAGLAGQTQVVVVLLFLVTTFLMMSLKDVNYALSASLAAGMVVFLQRLVQGDTSATAVDRFAATVIGVVIAFAVLGIVQVIGRQRRAAG